MLKIQNLTVEIEKKEILKNLNLALGKNEYHIIMGPNGSGKSTLAQTLMGHPDYKVTQGKIQFNKKDLLEMKPEQRALEGIFLAWQQPVEIPGVRVSSFLRNIYNLQTSKHTPASPTEFKKLLEKKLKKTEIAPKFMDRYLNESFSGGEKKLLEIIQMLVLEPKLAIIDEIDSGLDIDSLKKASKAINTLKKQTKMTVLLITHYTRMLKYIEPDKVHIMQNGKIIRSGAKKLAYDLEESGYGDSQT